MVSETRLVILLPLETKLVALDNTVKISCLLLQRMGQFARFPIREGTPKVLVNVKGVFQGEEKYKILC